jgi:hypothetical protein
MTDVIIISIGLFGPRYAFVILPVLLETILAVRRRGDNRITRSTHSSSCYPIVDYTHANAIDYYYTCCSMGDYFVGRIRVLVILGATFYWLILKVV